MESIKSGEEDDKSKPVMLFGRDIRKIPCFKHSMLYGIYGGFAAGLATFLFTSRVKLATNVTIGSYMSVTLVYWCICRYNYVKQKYALQELQFILQQKTADKSKEVEEVAYEHTKLVDT